MRCFVCTEGFENFETTSFSHQHQCSLKSSQKLQKKGRAVLTERQHPQTSKATSLLDAQSNHTFPTPPTSHLHSHQHHLNNNQTKIVHGEANFPSPSNIASHLSQKSGRPPLRPHKPPTSCITERFPISTLLPAPTFDPGAESPTERNSQVKRNVALRAAM